MIMDTKTAPSPQDAHEQQPQKSPRLEGQTFADMGEARRVPLGQLQTDEEARLAAEIEKLRG
jgi:hypothetical protein